MEYYTTVELAKNGELRKEEWLHIAKKADLMVQYLREEFGLFRVMLRNGMIREGQRKRR